MVVIGEIHKVDMRRFIPILISFVIIEGALQWLDVGIGSTFLWWCLNGVILSFFILCRECKLYKFSSVVCFYLIWVIFSAIRGVFMAEGYWDFKSMVSNLMFNLMPISICFFYYPRNLINVSRICLIVLPFIFLLLIPFAQPEAVGKILLIIPPFLLFIPRLTLSIKIYLISALVVVFVLGSLGARSTAVRFGVALLFSITFFLRRFLNKKFVLQGVWGALIIMPFIFLILAFSGTFNIFKVGDDYKGEFKVKDSYNTIGHEKEDLASDTRTFLYVEVINSAVKNGYVMLGHSLSRGYESPAFWTTDKVSSSRGERDGCEVALLNVFTNMGLIGVMLYSFIFLQASRNAIFKGKSYCMKVVGLWLAFRWVFSWIEEFTRFDINYIYIWAFVAMCYSPIYLNMSDAEFLSVIKSCFPFNKRVNAVYPKRLLIKLFLLPKNGKTNL